MNVDVYRGEVLESRHVVDAVVVGPSGRQARWGDPERRVIARSSLKFVQAIPLLATGAADGCDVVDDELALACASHSAEPDHVRAVTGWLERLGLGPGDLECGPDVPAGAEAARAFHRRGEEPAPIFNNCSGKHAGFLTVAHHLGHPTAGYIEADHPVQRLVTAAIASFTGEDLSGVRPGRDGCGIPVYAIPLDRLAVAMHRLVTGRELDDRHADAASRLVAAVADRHFWISGTDRHETRLEVLAAEPILVKVGAEGVFMAGLPERGLGVALKVRDGAIRAAEVAISAVLAWLGVVPVDQIGRPIVNKVGAVVGRIDVADLGPDG